MSEFRLKVFITVVKNQNFTKAARELFITQPAVSKHIHELEEQYQTSLFNRTGSKVELTKAGELLYRHAEHILDNFKLLEFEMNQLNETFSGELRLGASSTISQYVLPSLLALFIKRYPDIKLTLLSGNSHEIEQALLDNRIDIGMIEGSYRNPALKYAYYRNDEIVLICRSESIYAKEDEITLEECRSLPMIMREYGSGTLDVIEEKLSEKHLKLSAFNIILQLGSTESIKNFLLQTDCVAFVSVLSILPELKNGLFKVIEVTDFPLERTFQFITSHGALRSQAQTFISFASTHNK